MVKALSPADGRDFEPLDLLARSDIVIPILNERKAVQSLIERLARSCPGARILFVDNGSTDGTVEFLTSYEGVDLIRHDENLGYGRSILDGIAASEREFIVVLDADLEYAPEDIPRLLERLPTAGAVYGSRFLHRAEMPRRMAWYRQVGNRCVTTLFNLLYAQRLTDLYTGIRAFQRSVVASEHMTRSGFEFVLEVSARLAQRGSTITEVPVDYRPRSTGKSKMRHLREFLRFALLLIVLRFDGHAARSPD